MPQRLHSRIDARSSMKRAAWTTIAASALATALVFTMSSAPRAQGYPDRPIKVLVPLAAASAIDIVARIVGEKMGAILGHITGGADATTFQPMNVNFGLFPPIGGISKGKERKQAMAARALEDFDRWLNPSLDKLAQAPAAA